MDRRTVSGGILGGLAGLVAGPMALARADALPRGMPANPAGRTFPVPAATPVLSVEGRIKARNEGGAAGTVSLDLATLEGLGRASITTATPWYEGAVRFDGVPMAAILDAVGAEGTTVTAVALNDYSTDIPLGDFARFGVLLATHRDGVRMRASDKGPFFIVYPYDSQPELKARLYYSRSAWSVAKLVVA